MSYFQFCVFSGLYIRTLKSIPSLSLSLSLSPPNFRFLLLLRLSLWLINSSDCYSSSSLQDPFSASKFELCFTVLASPLFFFFVSSSIPSVQFVFFALFYVPFWFCEPTWLSIKLQTILLSTSSPPPTLNIIYSYLYFIFIF